MADDSSTAVLAPASDVTTAPEPASVVESGAAAQPLGDAAASDPPTLNRLLLETAERFSREACFRVWRGGRYRDVSYRHFHRQTLRLAAELRRRGGVGERVALWASSVPEWMVVHHAASLAGAVLVPIPQDLELERVHHILRDACARYVVVNDREQVGRLVSCDDLDPEVVWTLEGNAGDHSVPLAEPLAERVDNETVEALRAEALAVPPEALATLWYNTTRHGEPLGALFDQAQRALAIDNVASWMDGGDDEVAYTALPWSYMPSLLVAMVCYLRGVPSVLGQHTDLQIEEIQQASPTLSLTLPNALERAYEEQVAASLRRLPESTQKVFHWAVATGRRLRAAGPSASKELRERFGRADMTFFSRIRGAFGGRIRRLYTTGAPLARSLAESIEAIGLQPINTYSVTECGGFPTVNLPPSHRPDSCGPPATGYEVRLGERGEVLVRGPAVTRGYWGQPEATSDAISDDGWLRTGDFGRFDDEGHLYITGREGDSILLSTGVRVDPIYLGRQLMGSPLVDQAAVFGEGKPHPVALIAPNLEALLDAVRAEDPNASLHGDEASELDWFWPTPDGPVVTAAHPRVKEIFDALVEEVRITTGSPERLGGYLLIGQPLAADAETLERGLRRDRERMAEQWAPALDRLFPRQVPETEREITRVEVGPERLRDLLEKEAILDAWTADAGIAFLIELARRHQIDAPSVVHICDTAATVAQMETEEKPLSTALIVGDPVRISRVLPSSIIQLHRFEHIRRMRSRLVDLARMVDGRVLAYVVDRHGFVRAVVRLDVVLPPADDPILGPQFRLHSHISSACDAVVFFVPRGGRQVRVFAGGHLVGRYSSGDWAPENADALDVQVAALAEDRPWDAPTVRRLLRCAFRMSENNQGAIFVIGDADAVLARSDSPDISHFAWMASKPIAELYDEELINFAKQDGATVLDAATRRFRGCMVLLRPDASTEAEIGRGRGARHSSAAKMSAEVGALAITVSQDGPITVYDSGRRVLSL
ncbi:MAG: AMP-binding protein [Acidobacteriota bacterium]